MCASKMSAEEFASLKNEIETHQADVDAAFGRLDDFLRRSGRQTRGDTSTESASQTNGERLVLLERLVEAMTRLNAAYKKYVLLLEKRVGY
jgi:hypothetical protein